MEYTAMEVILSKYFCLPYQLGSTLKKNLFPEQQTSSSWSRSPIRRGKVYRIAYRMSQMLSPFDK